jgi:hypothetical protein
MTQPNGAAHDDAAHAPTRPKRGSPQRASKISKNTPELSSNSAAKVSTILTLRDFARPPPPRNCLYNRAVLDAPPHAGVVMVGTSWLCRPEGSFYRIPKGRRSPWCRREAKGSDSEAGGEVARLPHDGSQPTRAVPAFRGGKGSARAAKGLGELR